MTYWLCIINQGNWDVIREKNVWGIPESRIKLKPVKVFEKPVEFKTLIPKLKFITQNQKKWSGHLMGKAMKEIPEEDYKLIMSVAE